MKKKINFQKVIYIYRIYSVIYLLVAFNGFLNGQKLMNVATYLTAGAGAVILLILAVRYYKDCYKMKNGILAGAFLLSYILSSVLNIKYGFMENIQEVVWLALQMGIAYLASGIYSIEQIKKELKTLAVIVGVYCTIANLISISMIYWGYFYDYVDAYKVPHGLGFRWGRLWGIYDDPNHGAVISVVAILLLIYLFKEYKNKGFKTVIVLGIAVQCAYIGLANSRTAMLALGIGLCVYGGFSQFRKGKAKAIAIGWGILLFVLVIVGGTLMNPVNEKIDRYEQTRVRVQNTHKKGKKHTTAREKDLKKDESNGRIGIWKSGMEVGMTSPVYGTSYRNMTAYAKDNLPDTYIVNNAIVDYDSMHNMFVDVFVSQGIIGIILTLLLIGNTLWAIVKNFTRCYENKVGMLCMAMIIAMSVASMFYSYVFFLNSLPTYIFWICLGYLMIMLDKQEER